MFDTLSNDDLDGNHLQSAYRAADSLRCLLPLGVTVSGMLVAIGDDLNSFCKHYNVISSLNSERKSQKRKRQYKQDNYIAIRIAQLPQQRHFGARSCA